MSDEPQTLEQMLADSEQGEGTREALICKIVEGNDDAARTNLLRYLLTCAEGNMSEVAWKKIQKVNTVINEIKKGPLRMGVYHGPQLGSTRHRVMFPGGEVASCISPDESFEETVQVGDSIWVAPEKMIIIAFEKNIDSLGEEGILNRVLEGKLVEILHRGEEKLVLRAADALLKQLEEGEAEAGDSVVVNQRVMMAFSALPKPENISHHMFLDPSPPPDVVIARDIGNPPAYLNELITHLKLETENPELARKYGQRASCMTLLEGVSGAGKTHSIRGFWNHLYTEMSKTTGIPVCDLPPRVLRLRCASVLSQWLGQSDKRLDQFFDEVEDVVTTPFELEDGKEIFLPVLVIAEEIDALARERGGDQLYDRIQTTLLERMDSHSFADKLVFFICTTNVPHLVDPAFLRRAGGTVEHFGRLEMDAFYQVLDKHLNPELFAEGEEKIPDLLMEGLYGEEAKGVVKLTFKGTKGEMVLFPRDLMTCGLIDRAIQQSVKQACRDEFTLADKDSRGITLELLQKAFTAQVTTIVEQLRPDNAKNYISIPKEVHVTGVHKMV